MNRRSTFLLVFSITLFFFTLVTSNVFAGWVEVNKFRGISYISDGMVKQVPNGEDNSWSIFDVKRRVIIMVEPKQKSYMEVNTKEICEEISKMMEAMMAEMPAEQRSMMEQMMKGANSTKVVPIVKVDKIGSGGMIAGFDTVKYRVSLDGRPYKDLWLTNNAGIMKDVKDFMDYALDMNKEMVGCTQMGGSVVDSAPELTSEYIALMKSGWTMKEVNLLNSADISEVESLKKKDIPASEFKVPADYKKVDMMEMMGQMKR